MRYSSPAQRRAIMANVRQKDSDFMGKWAGMNYYAAEYNHTNLHPRPREIFVDKNLKPDDKKKTIVHEKVEAEMMKKGLSYPKAHKIALKVEKYI